MNLLTWTRANLTDEPALLASMQAFYAEEQLTFDPATASSAVRELFAHPALGQIFILRDSAHNAHGHLVLTFGFSLEFGGRFVLLDELYFIPALRGQGWARRTLDFAAEWASTHHAATLRLEVNRRNTHARSVYLKAGFQDDQRDLLTRRL